MPKHVLIVTQNFPPTNEMASRRFGLLVPHLEQHGWTPWVLTTHGTGPLPVRVPDERVFRIGRNSHRLPHSRDPSDPAPWGTRIAALLRSTVRWSIDRTTSRVYTLYPANLAWHRAVVHQTVAVQRWLPQVDAIVGTFMPAGALLIAAHLARVYRVKWLADVRDVASLIPGTRNPLARQVDRWIERWLFRTADGFLTVSPTLARLLAKMYGRSAAVVYNGWDSQGEAGSPKSEVRGHQSEVRYRPYLYYAGLLYPHRMRAADVILRALADRRDVGWRLRSLGPAHLERRLVAHARQLGVDDRVQVLPPCDPDVVAAESASALANVVLEDLDTRHVAGRGTLTGKFLKLLPLGPPVLAVARPDSDIGPILEHTGKGRLCSTTIEMVSFLDAALQTPESFRGDPPAIDAYAMRSQAAVLARALDECSGRLQESARAAA